MSARYVITSPRVGPVGDPYSPAPGVNVEALISGGFIAEVPGNPDADTPTPTRVKRNRTPDTPSEE